MRARSIVPHLILAALLLSVTAIIYAVPTGKIIGTVTDRETGQSVANASVTVVGAGLSAVTDERGCFIIRDVPPGTYTLTVSWSADQLITLSDVSVNPDSVTFVSALFEQKQPAEFDSVELKISAPSPVNELLAQVTGVVRNKAGDVAIRGGRSLEMRYLPPSHGGTAIVNGEPFDAMFFKNYGVNPFVDTEDDHLSTFAVDVDDAAFIMARSYLYRGAMPSDDAVRTEEFVNHFKYAYAAPHNATFKVYLEGAPSKFGTNSQMLKIGIKGMEIDSRERKPANLVFVIDISGSMGIENRLGLVKRALRMLVDELTPEDQVGIVVYGSCGKVLLEPTSIARREKILKVIEFLNTDGATNAEEGIRLGYRMAEQHFERGKINRIILCSDGVANVGTTGPDDILKQIKSYADKGITLSTVGFGMNNYNDILMEKLGDKGNGHYAYVDNIAEAHRVFVDNLTGNLQVIARDVKIQVDFNPDVVRSYRLLGYENRDVADNKFRDDKEDGGEIGAGHQVTALYEIKFENGHPEGQIGTVFIRYKDAEGTDVDEISRAIEPRIFGRSFENASFDFRLAACSAEFAEILRKSYWAKGSTLDGLLSSAKPLLMESEDGDVIELISLISKAQTLDDQLAQK